VLTPISGLAHPFSIHNQTPLGGPLVPLRRVTSLGQDSEIFVWTPIGPVLLH